MTKLEQAARQALGALEVATTPLAKDRQEVLRAITTLREALSGVQALSAAQVEVADAMADSQYLAGVSAGWNAANADDPNAALQKLHESRAGYLLPIRTAARALALSTPPAEQQAAPKAAPGDAIDEAMRERDDAEDFIDALLDEVLGHERPEWSNLYGRADALNDVQERMTALHKPAVDKAWGQFQSAKAAPQQEATKAAPGEPSIDSLRHQNKMLAETLGACILASGIVRKDIDGFTGPELLHFGEDLRSMLEAAPQPSPAAPATQQPKGDVVAYLDVGANGYLDLGSELSEDALQQLPKGRHALVIAGTYGIDGYVAAPQPAPDCHHRPRAMSAQP